MKNLVPLLFVVCWSCAHAENLTLSVVTDNQLNFTLNNISIILEKNDPNVFPAIIRLIELPDQGDDCAWVKELREIPDSSLEDSCPLKKLYLALSNWDIASDSHSYLIGVGNSWEVLELVVNRIKSQSDWDATLRLGVQRFVEGKVVADFLELDINNKHDVYTIQLKSHIKMPLG